MPKTELHALLGWVLSVQILRYFNIKHKYVYYPLITPLKKFMN